MCAADIRSDERCFARFRRKVRSCCCTHALRTRVDRSGSIEKRERVCAPLLTLSIGSLKAVADDWRPSVGCRKTSVPRKNVSAWFEFAGLVFRRPDAGWLERRARGAGVQSRNSRLHPGRVRVEDIRTAVRSSEVHQDPDNGLDPGNGMAHAFCESRVIPAQVHVWVYLSSGIGYNFRLPIFVPSFCGGFARLLASRPGRENTQTR